MISLLLTLLVFLVVAGLAYWALMKIAGAFGLPPQVVVLLQVGLVILIVVMLLMLLFGSGGNDLPRLRF